MLSATNLTSQLSSADQLPQSKPGIDISYLTAVTEKLSYSMPNCSILPCQLLNLPNRCHLLASCSAPSFQLLVLTDNCH
jgi:hypothetical protein